MKTLLLAPILAFALMGCNHKPAALPAPSKVSQLGSIEVTARLVEIPEGAIFKRDLYDYATVLKYEVEQVHRGTLPEKTILVGQYNPFKPRSAAADKRVKVIGGTLDHFEAGQRQRLALEPSLEDQFMGGVANKYFGKESGPIYWAVWTDAVQ